MTVFGQRCPRPRPQQGATLLEALIVISLLGVVAVGAFSFFAVGILGARLAEGLEQAVLLGERQVEEIKATAPFGDGSLSRPREAVDPEAFPGYASEIEDQEITAGLHRVTVRVFWTQRGRDREIEFTTYVRRGADW